MNKYLNQTDTQTILEKDRSVHMSPLSSNSITCTKKHILDDNAKKSIKKIQSDLPKLGQPRKWVEGIQLPEDKFKIGGLLSKIISSSQKEILSILNNSKIGGLLSLVISKSLKKQIILNGELRPSAILKSTKSCNYWRGSFSDGHGNGYFCAIGALAHEYFGWDGKAKQSPINGEYYIQMPAFIWESLCNIMGDKGENIIKCAMQINDGMIIDNHKSHNQYENVIEFFQDHGM